MFKIHPPPFFLCSFSLLPSSFFKSKVGFAFRVLNVDMDGFFTRNYRTFEQDVGELRSGAGETLEQVIIGCLEVLIG